MSKINLRKEELSPKLKEEVKRIVQEGLVPPIPFEIGKTYIFRTITMCDIGRISDIVGNYIILENAVWIPDTGSWSKCLVDPNEIQNVEPFASKVFLNTDSIVDASLFTLAIPVKKNK